MSIQPNPSLIKRRRWRSWHILCLIGVLLITGLYVYRSIRQSQAEAQIRAIIATIEKDDPHWKLDDLEAEYNKYPISPAFLKCIGAIPPGYLGWIGDDSATRDIAVDYQPQCRDFNVRYPEKYFQVLKALITDDKIQPLRIALLELGREPGGYRLPGGEKSIFEPIDETKKLLDLVIDEMMFAIHQGDASHLIMTLRMAMNITRLLEQSPHSFALRVASRQRSCSMMYLDRALALCQFTDQQLQLLQMVLDEQSPPKVDRVLKSFRAMVFNDWDRTRNNSDRQSKFFSRNTRRPDEKATWSEKIEYWYAWVSFEFTSIAMGEAELLEVCNRALAKSTKSLNQVLVHFQQATSRTDNLLVRNNLRACTEHLSEHLTAQAQLDSIRVAIASERYRLTNGAWPTTLAQLTPQYLSVIPLDPFTGQPLKYRQLSDGVVVYSIGEDCVDDQGQVLDVSGISKDCGTRLFNPELRGKKYEPPK